ncbi:MAG TPA: AzlD domain-containing protein [Steroidobacteraceae bacterium]|nr:AzlD domain-containing protein [Steroidobacteraceae bacterium]HRX88380.1 AzlD domain-containing protein [Steroidobacteraceae bacterium]
MSVAYTPLEMGLAIASVALATFVTRSTLLVVGERLRFAPRVEAALRYAPVCALAALVVPEILFRQDALVLGLDNPRLPAAIAASLFLLWKRSIVGCIAVGMSVYALWRYFVIGA